MLADAAQIRSTRETAPSYPADAMRPSIAFLPLMFILADSVACKDDEPTGAEFGEPCGADIETEVTTYCADGLECYIGYCEERCESDNDCQPIAGDQHVCKGGLCHILCDEVSDPCPQTLATPLECQFEWCAAVGGD